VVLSGRRDSSQPRLGFQLRFRTNAVGFRLVFPGPTPVLGFLESHHGTAVRSAALLRFPHRRVPPCLAQHATRQSPIAPRFPLKHSSFLLFPQPRRATPLRDPAASSVSHFLSAVSRFSERPVSHDVPAVSSLSSDKVCPQACCPSDGFSRRSRRRSSVSLTSFAARVPSVRFCTD
jgi:hypothetical protein